MSKILYGDLGGTKSVFASHDEETIVEALQFLKEKNISIYEIGKIEEYYYIKFSSVELKVLELDKLVERLNTKLLLSIAGVPFYNKKRLVKIISTPLGNYKFDSNKIYAFNDVKSFAYYWADIYDFLLAIQIGTGVNGAFYMKKLIKDWDYLVSPVEFGELTIENYKAGKLLGGRHYTNRNPSPKEHTTKFFIFLKNLLYLFPVRNIVIGGGMARYIDKGYLIAKAKKDELLSIIRDINNLIIVREKDWIYNIKGLELIRRNFLLG